MQPLRRKSSVAIEQRLRAQLEARKLAQEKLKMGALRFFVGLSAFTAITLLVATDVLAKEPSITEVNSAQLERILSKRDFLAVFWYTRSCKKCDQALKQIESTIADELSIDFVKINDKRSAKSKGVKTFPSLTFFRDGEVKIFDGDLTEEDDIYDFLKAENLLEIPGKIEDVNAETLASIVDDENFVTALFYDESDTSIEVIKELENIDDEADIFKIRFVKINDPVLAEEYSLGSLPCLVYFREGIPVVYHGDLTDEPEVLEWLIQNLNSANEEDIIETVGMNELEIMVENVDHLLVLFHDSKKPSRLALEALEHIDDDCDRAGVSLVAVTDIRAARQNGVDRFPTLIYYEGENPSIYDSDLTDHEEVYEWVIQHVEGSDIESVRGEILEKLIIKEDKIAVLFYESKDHKLSHQIINHLEEIDDDLDEIGVKFVKNGDASDAEEFGIENVPSLVLFERGVPNIADDIDLKDASSVLDWIMEEVKSDLGVEVVTDEMLQKLVDTRKLVAVLYYDKNSDNLKDETFEDIDDIVKSFSTKNKEIQLVKIDMREEAEKLGIYQLPALVFYDEGVPNLYKNGDLSKTKSVERWFRHIMEETNIEEVTVKMFERLRKLHDSLAVFVYDASFKSDNKILKDLENIDDDLDQYDLHLVRLSVSEGADSEAFISKFGIKVVPSLVLFKEDRIYKFEGDVGVEHEAEDWLRRKLSLDGNDNDEDLDDEEEDENTFIPLEGSMEDED